MINKPENLDTGIESYLKAIKEEGRSSPAGMHWNIFFLFLKRFKKTNHSDPPVPLILAASGEPDAAKHLRLSHQLYWALDNGCINEALSFLKNLDSDKWNSCPAEKWYESNH